VLLSASIAAFLARIGHFNKGEATGATGFAISDDRHVRDISVRRKGVADFLLGRAEGKISNEELHATSPAL